MALRMHTPFRRLSLVLATVLAASYCLVVAAPATAEERERRNSVTIRGDEQFDAEHGVKSGSGTEADPYVISGWDISQVSIYDTDSHLLIQDNAIQHLRLNWNGDRITLIDNTIGDLRVNENIKRTGAATSGLIAGNKIGRVGQLRHFDGIFEHNTVGENNFELGGPFFYDQAVNFDGFNGARFRDNTIFGTVDVRLHGHHHGSGFGEHSHHHSSMDHTGMDHSKRYHQVWVTNNKIVSPGPWALRYYDVAHSANDRTAASEQNEELNKPHVHYTKVHLNNNTLSGSGLVVEIFNARDDRQHTDYGQGLVEIRGNAISVERDRNETFEEAHGIDVYDARALDLKIIDNTIESTFTGLPGQDTIARDAGIYLNRLDDADVRLFGNAVASTDYGIWARSMTKTVQWWIKDLKTSGVSEDVRYDESVENEPKREG